MSPTGNTLVAMDIGKFVYILAKGNTSNTVNACYATVSSVMVILIDFMAETPNILSRQLQQHLFIKFA